MTIDEVRDAREALQEAGVYPSYQAILDWIGKGSKRDVARLMHTLMQEEPAPAPVATGGHTAARPLRPAGALPTRDELRAHLVRLQQKYDELFNERSEIRSRTLTSYRADARQAANLEAARLDRAIRALTAEITQGQAALTLLGA